MKYKKYKLKSRYKKGEIKGDLIARTKKAFKLTPEEKKSVDKVKRIARKKIPTKKKIKSYSKRIDFNRLF